jgi:hypothetical protein
VIKKISDMNHLSHPSKIPVPTFDLDTERTGCADRCQYGINQVCYVLNNPNENYPSRKEILKRNWELINSDQFVSILTKQIRQTRINDFRFWSSGDFYNLESIEKIIKVCENLPRVRFWIPTSRDDLLTEFLKENKIPSNVTIRLSAPIPDTPIPQFMKDFFKIHGVVFSETTTDPDAVNCHASLDGTGCQDCDQCWNPEHEITKYYIHGKKAQKNLMIFKERDQ